MAIMPMTKVMILSYRSEAAELLEKLQQAGILHILNSEEAMVSKDWPELVKKFDKPKDIEQLLNKLEKSISFLKNYTKLSKGLAGALAPRIVIDQKEYQRTVSSEKILDLVEQCEHIEGKIAKLQAKSDHINEVLEQLKPWQGLDTPIEELGRLEKAVCLTGLLPIQNYELIKEQVSEAGGAVEYIGQARNKNACLVLSLKEKTTEVQKLLRSAEFEPVNLSSFALTAEGRETSEQATGKVADLIEQYQNALSQAKENLDEQYKLGESLSSNLLSFEILYDHFANVLKREKTRTTSPATDSTVILEGWVKKADYPQLEKIVSGFSASSLNIIKPADDEKPPVEIENKTIVRPFEAITRLYGMPVHLGIDPTACLAPFFTLFFALCLADVGYGLVMVAAMVWLLIKLQGDKKLLWLFLICAGFTIPIGAITGGWFGDALSRFIPALNPLRAKLMLFDPMERPMTLFILSVILGYIQLMTGLLIAFAHNLRQKNFIAALCDQLTWLVMLNSIVVFGLSKVGMLPAIIGWFSGKLAIVPAIGILLFSHREGRWGGRVGMGAYNLFSAVFYLGDVLSYLRLMALCMVGGGIAMSINIIAEISLGIPYVGIIIMILIFVFGHALNLVLSALGAFVHTLRLQYVEYFTKFFVGGGRLFEPLAKEYKHIYIKKKERS